jgi:CRP-like cAMP-binding protein
MTTSRPTDWPQGGEDSAPAALLDHLWPSARVVRLRPGQIVIAHSTLSNEVYFVLSGSFEVLITARDGQDVVVRDLGAGAIFGDLAALDRQPRSATVTATSESSVARVSAETFMAAVLELPEASCWFMKRLGKEVRRLTDKIFELSALAARGRLHCELLRLVASSPRSGGFVRLEPAPTHESLAQRIGSQREAVSRELARLEKAAILRRARRFIEIDVSKLANLVETELGHPPAFPAEQAEAEAEALVQPPLA